MKTNRAREGNKLEYKDKTKKQLINELVVLCHRLSELEASESGEENHEKSRNEN